MRVIAARLGLHVPDTPAHAATSGDSRSTYPKVRVVTNGDSGTHAIRLVACANPRGVPFDATAPNPATPQAALTAGTAS